MDVALNRESALHKGIESRVSGDADIFLMPIMEVGNVAIKGLLWGIVWGVFLRCFR